MFMMTTAEEDERNERVTKDNYFAFNSQKNLDFSHRTEIVKRTCLKSFSGENLSPQKQNVGSHKPTIENHVKFSIPVDSNKSLHQDEGYSTDSKSNASPSTTSPLSSSFSSLSTFDGSFHSPTSPGEGISPGLDYTNHSVMQGNVQRCPSQKPSLIQGNGKIHVNRHAFVMAKKKDAPQEMQESASVNLEDRLRALTTIEEEEPGISSVFVKEHCRNVTHNAPVAVEHVHHNQSNARGGGFENNGQEQSAGFFRAVPVEIAAPQYLRDQRSTVENRNDHLVNFPTANNDHSFQVLSASGHNENDKNWHDYRRYFEKDCDIPLHNIDALNRGKFINAGSENADEKNINRQLGTNIPESSGGRVGANVAVNNRQSGLGRDSAQSQSNEGYNSGGFHGHPTHNSATSSGQFHGSFLNDNDQRKKERISNQNIPSSTESELPFPYTTHHSPHINADNQYCLQRDQSIPFQQPHHQHQHIHQPPHNQNQHLQQHTFRDLLSSSEQAQQHIGGPQAGIRYQSSGSFNSLPRQYEDQRQRAMFHPEFQQPNSNQFSDEDVMFRRSWASSSTRAIPERVERNSWQPESRSQLSNSVSADRFSLDLGNIPQLQKQIRATSEMCLQASKRHVFASSADIYKLFQGQKKPSAAPSSVTNTKDFGRGQIQNHRHSFHALPGGSWTRSQQKLNHDQQTFLQDPITSSINVKQHGSLSTTPLPSHRVPPSPGPLRADHTIPLPQTSWSGNNFAQPISSSSMVPLPLLELPHIQRQSSGYSSENELQQIEQNAKAVKRAKNNRSNQHSGQGGGIHSDLEFVPVDPSQDHDSSSSITTESEPVYVNQPMLSNARSRGSNKSSPMQQWHQMDSTPPPPPIPARPQRLQPPSLNSSDRPADNLHLQDSVPHYNVMMSDHHTYTQNSDTGIGNRASNNNNIIGQPCQVSAVITQKQIINLNQKPITINSYVPNHPYTNPNSNNADQMIDERAASLPVGQFASQQPLDFPQSSEQLFTAGGNTHSSNYFNDTKRSNSVRSSRSNSSPRVQLSPLEVAQVLDVPFATNVISDECGDRLSTLV